MLENEAKFIQHKFGEDRVEEKSTTRFFPLNYDSRVDFVRIIFRSEVQVIDSIHDFGGITKEFESAYFVEA